MSIHSNLSRVRSETNHLLKTRRQAIKQSLSLPFIAHLGVIAGASGLLTACGGGSNPPVISLALTPTSGKEGDAISLSAQVEADEGLIITEVSFYRVTDSAEILIATVFASPYLLQTTIPSGTAGTTIQYGARATDSDGQTTSSALATVTVAS